MVQAESFEKISSYHFLNFPFLEDQISIKKQFQIVEISHTPSHHNLLRGLWPQTKNVGWQEMYSLNPEQLIQVLK